MLNYTCSNKNKFILQTNAKAQFVETILQPKYIATAYIYHTGFVDHVVDT